MTPGPKVDSNSHIDSALGSLNEAQVPTLILLPSLHTAMRAIVLVLGVPLGIL